MLLQCCISVPIPFQSYSYAVRFFSCSYASEVKYHSSSPLNCITSILINNQEARMLSCLYIHWLISADLCFMFVIRFHFFPHPCSALFCVFNSSLIVNRCDDRFAPPLRGRVSELRNSLSEFECSTTTSQFPPGPVMDS